MKINCVDDNCNSSIDIRKGALNADIYGSNSFVFKCSKCNTKVRVTFTRSVSVSNIQQAQPNEDCSFE